MQSQDGFKIKFQTSLLLLITCLTLVLTACNENSTSSSLPLSHNNNNIVRIYSSLPESGVVKAQSDSMVNAMKLAVEQVNDTVAGFKIDYVPLDNALETNGKQDAGQEAANANKVANDPDAIVYIGAFDSDIAKVSIPILNKAGLLTLSPGNSYPGFTRSVAGVTKDGEPGQYYPNGLRNYFHLVPDDDLQGPVDVNYTATKLHAKSVYIVDDGGGYGISLAKSYELDAAKNDLKVLAHDSLTDRDEDYKATAAKIKNSTADVIFFGGNNQQQAGKFLVEVRAVGLKTPFLGGEGIQGELFLKEIGSQTKGVFSSIGLIDPANLPQKGQDFLKAYKAKYGADVLQYSAYAYECMNVALYTFNKVGKKDRVAILQKAANTKDFDGILGKWSFDKNGDTTQNVFSFYTARNGSWFFDSNVNVGAE